MATDQPVPRYEFRTFARDFGLVAQKIRRASTCLDIRESEEIYIVTTGKDHLNLKIRDGRLQIKQLLDGRHGLERWQPTIDAAFPLSPELVRDILAPVLGLQGILPAHSQYSPELLLAELTATRPTIRQARVFKRRFRFAIDHCPTEIDQLSVNGAAIGSVAVESEVPETLQAVIARIGLDEYENINYPRALRCIMGMEMLPKAWF